MTCIPKEWCPSSPHREDVTPLVTIPITELEIEGISLDSLMTKCIQLILGQLTVVHLVGAFNAARNVCDSCDDVKIGEKNQELYAQLTNAMVKFFTLWNVCMDSPLAANFAPVVASAMVMFVVNNMGMKIDKPEEYIESLPGFLEQGYLKYDDNGLPVYTESRVPRTRKQTALCLNTALADMAKNSQHGFLSSSTGCGFTPAQLNNPAIAGHREFMIQNGWKWYEENYSSDLSRIFPMTK